MNNKCARCEKTVYPIEELKVLDKIWHKSCFKCQECGMILSMKSYKGFNKFPYCNAHIPQVKPTTTVNSLEARRLAELTKLQSQVKYHENFEKSKGKLTQIADDMETQRLKQTSKIISNVSYHGELERKHQMEQKRNQLSDYQTNEQNKLANNNLINNQLNSGHHLKIHQNGNSYLIDNTTQQLNNLSLNNQLINNNQMINKSNVFTNGQPIFVQTKEQHAQILNQQTKIIPKQENVVYQLKHQPQQQNYINPQKVAQYVNTSQQLLHQQRQQQQQQLINHQRQFNNHQQVPINSNQINQQIQYNNQITNGNQFNGNNHFIRPQQQQQPNIYMQQQKHVNNDWPPKDQQNRVFRAIYDYTAADVDEVSFLDGDLITDCVFIDEGWMTGVIQRTGQYGMLPANYVQPHYIHS